MYRTTTPEVSPNMTCLDGSTHPTIRPPVCAQTETKECCSRNDALWNLSQKCVSLARAKQQRRCCCAKTKYLIFKLPSEAYQPSEPGGMPCENDTCACRRPRIFDHGGGPAGRGFGFAPPQGCCVAGGIPLAWLVWSREREASARFSRPLPLPFPSLSLPSSTAKFGLKTLKYNYCCLCTETAV